MYFKGIERDLLLLSESKKNQIDLMRNGARIQQAGAQLLGDLMLKACADRFALSESFLRSAIRLRTARPSHFRSSISRAYYAMYHAARCLAYVDHQGDDFEVHKKLHNALPDDFPDADIWKNALKDARTRRNEADYEPYPSDERQFQASTKTLLSNAIVFLGLSKAYLRQKGCQI